MSWSLWRTTGRVTIHISTARPRPVPKGDRPSVALDPTLYTVTCLRMGINNHTPLVTTPSWWPHPLQQQWSFLRRVRVVLFFFLSSLSHFILKYSFKSFCYYCVNIIIFHYLKKSLWFQLLYFNYFLLNYITGYFSSRFVLFFDIHSLIAKNKQLLITP